ncbi:DNA-binding HTH domain-containing protein [Tepidicaulis marinus]|uniref:DNA-binding HTH domain-containing protein n=1 Tax=Tepidicaulis marinus TaxID=1333998 RepID=A0A081BFF9_9HYPH|nr:LuxR family transcriptional regulator [Tepidicaulis marinus]GAK46777.1 DNA-binding HTH domain-containing protein [Tepidicaulis marinus]
MLDRFMERLAECQAPEDAFGALMSASHELGFDACSYTNLALLARPWLNAERMLPTFGLPEKWGIRYAEQAYHTIDPILLTCRASGAPLVWSDIEARGRLKRPQKTFMQEAAEFGLREGLSFTIGRGQPEMIAVAYVSGEPRRISRKDTLTARSVATIFHLVYDQLTAPQPSVLEDCRPALSTRELQCLEWVCRGKSSWAIAEILGLSPKTIDHYLANASRKLETSSRVTAAVRAVQLGLIQP